MNYPEGFRAKMVGRMIIEGLSAKALSQEAGAPHQTTLSEWLRQAGEEKPMSKSKSKSKRPQDWAAREKLAVVLEADSLAEDQLGAQLGALLRGRGLHQAHLDRWREQMLQGLEALPRARGSKSPESRQIRELERDLQRKDKALAEVSALLILKKKAQDIWGEDVGEPTTRRSGK
jgi:transposase